MNLVGGAGVEPAASPLYCSGRSSGLSYPPPDRVLANVGPNWACVRWARRGSATDSVLIDLPPFLGWTRPRQSPARFPNPGRARDLCAWCPPGPLPPGEKTFHTLDRSFLKHEWGSGGGLGIGRRLVNLLQQFDQRPETSVGEDLIQT